MFNTTLIGRLTKDPEQKTTTGGSVYTNFRVAVNNGKDKAGADKPATFIDCSVFGKTGEFAMNYARKGARVCVSGSLEVGMYTNKNTGEAMLSVSVMADAVELIDWPDKDQAAPVQQQGYPQQQQLSVQQPGYPPQGQYGTPPQGQPPMQQGYPPQGQYAPAPPPGYPPQGQYGTPPAAGQPAYPPQNQAPPQGYPPQQNYGASPQGQQPPGATPWANSPI